MIGQKLREIRQAKGLSITELAKRTGLTPSFISQLERDVTNVSLDSLRQICRALEMPIFHLFLEQEDLRRNVIRAGERRVLGLPNSPVVYEQLSRYAPAFNLEVLLMTLEPGDANVAEPFSHRGEEVTVVLGGELAVEVGGEKYVLQEGDSIHLDSNIPHRYVNAGQVTAKAIISITPPSY